MVDQEIRVLGDENIIANPKNSQKQYPLTFKAVPNVIVYGRKKADLNFTVPITEGTNFNFNLERTAIIFSDSFNLEEYSYIMVKNPFEEISDFFYVSSLEELDPTGKEFNEFNDEVVKWLRRLVNIISNRCMIFETTLFKDLNNFPNIKTGQTFIRTEDGWTGITIRDINSELDLIFNKYVEEINKKIQEHQTQMNELLEQWKQDIQKYAENVKQYEIVRVVTQTGHGFVFEPVMYSVSQRKFVKAVFPHGADGIAARVDDNNFKLVWAGRVEIPATAKDTQQRDFVLGEYYFLGEGSNGGIQREKPDTYYQHLFQVMYSDELRQNIADVLLSVPINQKGKRWDVGEAKTTVNDIEELKMSDFPVDKVVEVLGYYKAGDGADHKRIIKAEDDGSGVQLSNGLWANIVKSDIYHSNWFGANKSGDVTDIFKKMIAYNKPLVIDKGEYNISEFIFDVEGIIQEDNGVYSNKSIIRTEELPENKPLKKMIGVFDYNGIMTQRGHQSVAYNKNKQEYILGFSNTDDELSTLIFLDKNFSFIKKVNVDLGHCNGLTYNPKTNKLISGGYLGSTAKANQIFVLNYDTLAIEKTVDVGYTFAGISYDEEKDIYVVGATSKYSILDNKFIIIKSIEINEGNEYEGQTSQDVEFFNGNYLNYVSDWTSDIHIISADLKGNINKKYTFLSKRSDYEPEGIVKIDNHTLLATEYVGTRIQFFKFDFTKTSLNVTEINIPTRSIRYVDSNAKFEGNGTSVYPYKTISYALEDNVGVLNLTLNLKGIFEESIKFTYFNNITLQKWGDIKPVIKGQLSFSGISHAILYEISLQPSKNIDRIIFSMGSNVYIYSSEIIQPNLSDSRGIGFYRSSGFIMNTTFKNCWVTAVANEGSICSLYNCTGINNTHRFSVDGGIIVHAVSNFDNNSDLNNGTGGEIYPRQAQISELNTPYHAEKMKEEGVYSDFTSYMDEKTLYDKQQKKLEQDKQSAYREALKENPELTYEEFMSVQPMILNLVEDPQPSQALKKFMDKYL